LKKNKPNLILIFARAGSYDIARQNLTLINNKPLFYYVLNTALKYKKADVYVSTDSKEIKELTKMYGGNVIDRPKNLTNDSTTLEKIAHHSLMELKKNGLEYKKCLILNPKFPLIKLKTIQKIFSKLNENKTIFGYGTSRDMDDDYKQIIQKKEFAKLFDVKPHMIKLKRIVAFETNKFLQRKKFSKEIYGLKLSNLEILSLINYHDFGIFEKIIQRKKILVRVDGSNEIGLGHVYNMLTVLNHFRNDEILIVMKSKKDLGKSKFKEQLYKIKTYRTNFELASIIKKFEPDMIFNDILDTDIKYMKSLIKKRRLLVNFEDLGNGKNYADLIFNPIFSSTTKKKNEYFGSDYACVRDEFRIWQNDLHIIKKNVENILITFGGTDPSNKTLKILKIIFKTNQKNIKFNVILGLGLKNKNEVKNLANEMKNEGFNIEIIERIDFLAKIMKDSDFVISSNGRTIFELASMKKPIISISVNEREKHHCFVEQSKIGYNITLNSKKDEKIFLKKFENMLQEKTRKKIMKNFDQLELLNGVDKVKHIIENTYETLNSS